MNDYLTALQVPEDVVEYLHSPECAARKGQKPVEQPARSSATMETSENPSSLSDFKDLLKESKEHRQVPFALVPWQDLTPQHQVEGNDDLSQFLKGCGGAAPGNQLSQPELTEEEFHSLDLGGDQKVKGVALSSNPQAFLQKYLGEAAGDYEHLLIEGSEPMGFLLLVSGTSN